MGKYLTTVKSAHWLLTPGLSMRGFPGTRVLQFVALCCSVLHCVAVCCSVVQCGAGVLQCIGS